VSEPSRRRVIVTGALGASTLALPGCWTIHETPPASLPAAGSRQVMLVGRVEVLPRLSATEQDIDVKNDLFNGARHMRGRAVIYLADKPEPGSLQVYGADIINPTLDQTFFFVVRRSERFIARGSVVMEWRDLTPNSKAMAVDTAELKLPAPLEIDIRAEDQALYLGTLRLHRDTFNTLLKVELIDQHAPAQTELRERFGPQAGLRRALLKLPQSTLRAPAAPPPRGRV
jgi:hypothetical protein